MKQNEIMINNDTQTITTLEIAEMMEIEHSKLLRKLEGDSTHKGIIQVLGEAHLGVTDYFIPSTYITKQNKEMPCYKSTRLGCDFLANKFTGEKGIIFTARYVKRFAEMEQELKPKVPQSYKEALLETVRLLEENEKLEEENKKQKAEIIHKENVIIGLVDDIDLATKRQRITQIVRFGADGNYQDRYNLLYQEFERKYHCNLKLRMKSCTLKPKIKNTMDYIDRAMDKIPQLYEIACKLFENDVEKLKAEWDSII